MMPSFVLVRLGKWNEIFKDDSLPDAQLTYAGIIYDFARGMAFVNTGHPDSAHEFFFHYNVNHRCDTRRCGVC
jgi:hypothetical protein